MRALSIEKYGSCLHTKFSWLTWIWVLCTCSSSTTEFQTAPVIGNGLMAPFRLFMRWHKPSWKSKQQASRHGFQYNHIAADNWQNSVQWSTAQKLQMCYIWISATRVFVLNGTQQNLYMQGDIKLYSEKLWIKAMDTHASTSENTYLTP
jgi:hypothetical protein